MIKRLHLLSAIISLALVNTFAVAQTQPGAQAGAPAVTAAAAEAGARFSAPEGVSQLRREIYSQTGGRVFDTGMRPGSILDWKASEVQQGLADGSYLCVVTVKDLRGRLSQRVGSLSLQAGQVSLSRAAEPNAAQSRTLSAERQARKIEHDGAEDALTVVTVGRERALTLSAHDGRDGQVTATSGALTFRTGDVLTGADKEQMRVTPEGRVGIGTDAPEDTLDVAGTIRARGGIRFDDGTVLTSAGDAAKGSTVVASSFVAGGGGGTTISAAGTGSTNHLSKWLDGAGTLGDSVVSESGGNVGIGTASPASTLDVNGTANVRSNLLINGATQILDTGNKFSLRGDPSFATKAGYMTFTSGDDVVTGYMGVVAGNHPSPGAFVGSYSNHKFNFRTNNLDRLTIDPQGNVGVGTTSPQSALQVNGYIQLSTVSGAPPAADCDAAAEWGRMKVDPTGFKFYVCTAAGWKSTALQ